MSGKRGRDDDGHGDRTSYTSEFLDSVSDLPLELRKCFSLVRDLDEYCYELVDGQPQMSTNNDIPGVEAMKRHMINCANACSVLDKAAVKKMRRQWSDLQAAEKKVLEIATEKNEIAQQAQRHIHNNITRLVELYMKFEKELAKTDQQGLGEVLQRAPAPQQASSSRRTAPKSRKPKKQPSGFDLVGSWIAVEYDDGSSTAGGDSSKVWYNGLVMAFDPNLMSYLVGWEVGGEEWIEDLKDGEYMVVDNPIASK